MNASQLGAKQVLKTAERGGVATCHAFKDGSSKQWFVSCGVWYFCEPSKTQLLVETRRHIAIQDQRRRVYRNDAGEFVAFGSPCDERLQLPRAAGSAPRFETLFENPHAVDVGVEAEAASCGSLIGEASIHCILGRDRNLRERADERPCSGTYVGDAVQVRGD